MKKLIILLISCSLFLFAGCNLQVALQNYSHSELINMSIEYCNNINGTVNVFNNTIDLLYLNCIVNNVTTELYDDGNSYVERHDISKSHKIRALKDS